MSFKNRDLSAAAHRFRSHLNAVAGPRAVVPVSALVAVSVACAAGALIRSTPGVLVPPTRTATVASADFALSPRQAARATHGRWLAARRVCDEMLEGGGPDALATYSICIRNTLGDDPVL